MSYQSYQPVYFIEADGRPVPTTDAFAWSEWLKTADRVVAKTYRGDGVVKISTVFFGCGYETMIFWTGHELDEESDHYATRDAAKRGHDQMVARVDAVIEQLVMAL